MISFQYMLYGFIPLLKYFDYIGSGHIGVSNTFRLARTKCRKARGDLGQYVFDASTHRY